MFSSDKQARQSSGNKSFFSRSSKKDKAGANNDNPLQDIPPAGGTTNGLHSGSYAPSIMSRHSHRSSISTVQPDGDEYYGNNGRAGHEGLNMQAG
ncbi:hypothetical protein LTR53_018382, partial [Teratosphaeriaceae sp. CCFEE 6253]